MSTARWPSWISCTSSPRQADRHCGVGVTEYVTRLQAPVLSGVFPSSLGVAAEDSCGFAVGGYGRQSAPCPTRLTPRLQRSRWIRRNAISSAKGFVGVDQEYRDLVSEVAKAHLTE